MSALQVAVAIAAASLLMVRWQCLISRGLGALFFAIAFAMPIPAFADQNLQATDSAQVDCLASARDLTRISLVEDEFASVSKISTGNSADDFSVVNEPVRGDIYLSVPDGFARAALSFFGTSKRGYVYKFVCRVSGEQASQVFVSNPAIAREKEAEAQPRQSPIDTREAAIELVQAMYGGGDIEGYEMRERSLKAVYIGALKVQLIAEYKGPLVTGRVLRIENTGPKPIELTDQAISQESALAIAIAKPSLPPGTVTTAYLISQAQ